MTSWKHFASTMICLAAFYPLFATAQEPGTSRVGDLEMRCVALPTTELTPEAAKEFNVTRDPRRGLLTVTLFRHLGPGKTQTQQAQVFAGGITHGNNLFSIPVREVHKGDAVYYLGEFRLAPPDTLRFIVNSSVLGKPLKADFSRGFGAP